MPSENNRETGARKLQCRPAEKDRDREHIGAAGNKPPRDRQGLSQKPDETIEKTRQSDGVQVSKTRMDHAPRPPID